MNVTDRFIDYVYVLSKMDFPTQAVLRAKKCLLDYLGVTLAGARMSDNRDNRLLDCFGNNQGDSTIIGLNRKVGLLDATLLNGMNSHVAELDDGIRFGMVHPGAPVISALLPLAEQEKTNGTKLLTAIIVGYETVIRLATAMQPSHKLSGFHATGTCGTIGAALGSAVLLGLAKPMMKHALSAAATSASGILNVIKGGSELKPYNAGHAALGGLMAASLARAGFKGPEDVLSGNRGFLQMMAPKCDCGVLERKEKDLLGIEKVYIKPYAACRHCHPAIEAALRIKSRNKIAAENIHSIKVITYRLGVEGHEHNQIAGICSAKMSTPFSVAVALCKGKAGIDEFTLEAIADPGIISLSQKVTVYADDYLSALVPNQRPAIVEIVTTNNQKLTERVDLAKGEPENPLTEDEIKEKFVSLALFAKKSKHTAGKIIECVWNVENDLGKLFPLL